MKFDAVEWPYSRRASSFTDKMRKWIADHQNAEIVDVSYKTATNRNGAIMSVYAFIIYRVYFLKRGDNVDEYSS